MARDLGDPGDSSGADIIACWEHNWPDCTEEIALREIIG